jgi:hypothetical protein
VQPSDDYHAYHRSQMADEGYWLMTAVEPWVPGSDDTHTYVASDGVASQTIVAPGVGDRFVSTVTWSRPHDIYRAGEMVQLTLNVKIVEYVWNGTNDGYLHQGLNSVGEQVAVRIDAAGLQYGATAGAIRLTDANGDYIFKVLGENGAMVVPEIGAAVSAAFPAGYESGDLKAIRLETHAGTVSYTYTWVIGEAPADTTTAPAGGAMITVTVVRHSAVPPMVSHDDGVTWSVLRTGDRLLERDKIETGRDTRVILTYPDGSVFRLKSNSRLEILGDGLALQVGDLWLNLYKEDRVFKVLTPTTVTACLGTTFSVAVAEDGSTAVRLSEGSVEVAAGGAAITLTPGQMVQAEAAGVSGEVAVFDVAEHEAAWAAEFADEAPESDGMPAWSIVVIVLGCLAGLGVVWTLVRRKKTAPASPSQWLLPGEPPPPPAP